MLLSDVCVTRSPLKTAVQCLEHVETRGVTSGKRSPTGTMKVTQNHALQLLIIQTFIMMRL